MPLSAETSAPCDAKEPRLGDFLIQSEKFRSELGVPGYWNALQENCEQWAGEANVSRFWQRVKRLQPTWSGEFQKAKGGSLLASPLIPEFTFKRLPRLMDKVFQGAIKTNGEIDLSKVWSPSGAPVPMINDLVRTRIECSFLDGVEFFGNKLEQLAKVEQVQCDLVRKGRLEGYFAQHFSFEHKVLFRFGGGAEPTTIKCEVQIATALATRIWTASHDVYAQWRGREEDEQEWQWTPSDPRFVARQLGHMIHLADGLLVQLRDTARRKT
jgi:hypothetical protein